LRQVDVKRHPILATQNCSAVVLVWIYVGAPTFPEAR
jgi:hypothetical protein